MFIDRFADNLKTKLDERKELKEIEREAYQKEKCIVDADLINDKRIDAEQKGIDKAHKKLGGFGARLDRAAERMAENKNKTVKSDTDVPSMINFGTKL
jgi:hypothetical protein